MGYKKRKFNLRKRKIPRIVKNIKRMYKSFLSLHIKNVYNTILRSCLIMTTRIYTRIEFYFISHRLKSNDARYELPRQS